MKKVTRYENFQSLKLDSKSSETNSAESEERHVALEKFLTVLKSELVAKKKPEHSTVSHGQ